MRFIIISILCLMLLSCKNQTQSTTSQDSHAHDAEGNHVTTSSGKVPRLDYTIWTLDTELFVEFPVLIVGSQSRFAAHFTAMDGHQAIKEGSVTATLIVGDKGIRKTVNNPSSPGIFSPVLQPVTSGVGQLEFILNTNAYSDTIRIPQVKVYPNLAEAQKDLETSGHEDENIEFLKEQAWKMEFQTAKATQKEVFETLTTSGVWQSTPNSTRTTVANANGKVNFVKQNMIIGKAVRQGEVIMNLSSKGLVTNNLDGDLEVAKINWEQAKSIYDRKKSLYEDKIIPKSEFEPIQQDYLLAKAKYEALKKGYSASGYSTKTMQITAPISGYISDINVSNGGFVNEGAELFTVSKSKANVLEVQVSPRYVSKLNDIQNIWYKTFDDRWQDMNTSNGKILSIDKIVTTEKPNLSLFAQINKAVKMPQGSFTEVSITTGKGKNGIVIPSSALLESYGKYSVIVQLGGELFEERNIVVGSRNGNEVEVIKGLQQGEMVVTKGAYQVKMQSMAGEAPAHGHAH